MDELKEDIKVIRESQIRMEADLKYHIKRTDQLEKMHDNFIMKQNAMDLKMLEISKPTSFKEIAQVGAWVVAIGVGAFNIVKEFLKAP